MNIDEEHVKSRAGLVLLKVCFHKDERNGVCFVCAWRIHGQASLVVFNGRLRIVCFGDFDWSELDVFGEKESYSVKILNIIIADNVLCFSCQTVKLRRKTSLKYYIFRFVLFKAFYA